jgi:hypothetical protein
MQLHEVNEEKTTSPDLAATKKCIFARHGIVQLREISQRCSGHQ